MSYFLAWLRFEVQLWWLILTGRGRKDAPDSLERAYNRTVYAWNRKHGLVSLTSPEVTEIDPAVREAFSEVLKEFGPSAPTGE